MGERVRDDPAFRIGGVLALLALLQLAAAWIVNPQWGLGLGGIMAAELVTGREAAIPLALDQGVPPWWIAGASILQNLALAALIVPMAMAAAAQAKQGTGRVARLLHRIHQAANANRHRAASAWGIFAFMLVPFLANGSIIAGLIGRLIGIDVKRLALAVAGAVVITATAWSYLYAWLVEALAQVDPRIARVPAILAILVTAAAAVRLLWGMRQEDPAAR